MPNNNSKIIYLLLGIIVILIIAGVFFFRETQKQMNYKPTDWSQYPINSDTIQNSTPPGQTQTRDNVSNPDYKPNTPKTDLVSYIDPTYNFSLSFDKTKSFTGDRPFGVDSMLVKAVYICVRDGVNYSGDQVELKQMGFSDLSACQYKPYGPSNQAPTVDSIVTDMVNHKLKPYGTHPKVESIIISNQPAKVIYSDPDNKDGNNNDVAIVIKLPEPLIQDHGYTSYILILYTSKPFVQDIISSFKFN